MLYYVLDNIILFIFGISLFSVFKTKYFKDKWKKNNKFSNENCVIYVIPFNFDTCCIVWIINVFIYNGIIIDCFFSIFIVILYRAN